MNKNLLEGNYTIELRKLLEDENFNLFDFDYDFYEPMHRHDFEQKFIDYYFFYEIGFETVLRFKQMLRAKLNLKMRYYSQLYQTEVESSKCSFMLNKDLKETFIRENTRQGNASQKGNATSKSSSDNNINSTSENNSTTNNNTSFKESAIENGNATLDNDSLTTINQNQDTSKSSMNDSSRQNSSGTSTGETESQNETSTNESGRESTTLISQGNIGITSSGQLLEDWRKILINIDEMIIEECRDLFMLIY